MVIYPTSDEGSKRFAFARTARRLLVTGPWILFLITWIFLCWRMPLSVDFIKAEPIHAQTVRGLIHSNPAVFDIIHANDGYPPAYYLAAFSSCTLFQTTARWAMALPNLIQFFVVLYLMGALTKKVFGRPNHLATFFVGFYLFQYAVAMNTDMTFICAVTTFFYAAIRLGIDDSWKNHSLLAFSVAYALLAKQTAPLYLATPLVWVFWERSRENRLAPFFVIRLSVAVLAGSAVALAIFYRGLRFFQFIDDFILRSMYTSSAVPADSGLIAHALYYPLLLISNALPLVVLILLDTKGIRTTRRRPLFWVITTVAVPMAVLSFFPTKYSNLIMPVVPIWILAFTILVVVPAGRQWRAHRVRTVVFALFCGLMTAVFVLFNFVKLDISVTKRNFHSAVVEMLEGASETGRVAVLFPDENQLNELNDFAQASTSHFHFVNALPMRIFPRRIVIFRFGSSPPDETCFTREEIPSWLRVADTLNQDRNALMRIKLLQVARCYTPVSTTKRFANDRFIHYKYGPKYRAVLCERRYP